MIEWNGTRHQFARIRRAGNGHTGTNGDASGRPPGDRCGRGRSRPRGLAGTAAADGKTPSRLHTDGRWVRDADGEEVRLRGLATASMGFYEVEGIHPKTPTEVVGWASNPARGWYPNVVRLPVTQWDVDQLGSARWSTRCFGLSSICWPSGAPTR
ncbi:hypothetical protein ACFQL4_25940 [Halosimplex aquaticum]